MGHDKGMKRVQLTVHGRVQGVYYRASTEQQARALGVTGWVRNLPDGSVKAEIQGAVQDVDALTRWAHDGPAAARVDRVDVRDIDPVENDSRFEVR